MLLCCNKHVCLQDIVPEGEWQEFLDILKKPLPITFRINGSGRFANELRQKMESDFFSHFSEGPVMVRLWGCWWSYWCC
jgi:multisite-specific tRNA:(cytosine-C5)-methyltransferase/tRNA (cytosine34-C5)-methyltransferase